MPFARMMRENGGRFIDRVDGCGFGDNRLVTDDKDARRRDFILFVVIAIGQAMVAVSLLSLLYVVSTVTRWAP